MAPGGISCSHVCFPWVSFLQRRSTFELFLTVKVPAEKVPWTCTIRSLPWNPSFCLKEHIWLGSSRGSPSYLNSVLKSSWQMPGMHQSKRKQMLVCSSHGGWVFTMVGRMGTSSCSRHPHEGWSHSRSSTSLPVHDTCATATANSHPWHTPMGELGCHYLPSEGGKLRLKVRATGFLLFLPARPGHWKPAWVHLWWIYKVYLRRSSSQWRPSSKSSCRWIRLRDTDLSGLCEETREKTTDELTDFKWTRWMDREKIPPLAPKWCCCYSISDQSRNRGSKKRKDATSEEISFIKKPHLLKEVQPCYHVQQQHQVRDSLSPVLVWLLHTKPIQKCRSTSSTDTTL